MTHCLIRSKIIEEGTLAEQFLKVMVDFKTIIVIIIEQDGKIQKSWFEKGVVDPSMTRVQCER